MSDALDRSFSLSIDERRKGVVVVSLAGELALANSTELLPTLKRLSTTHSGIVLDVSRVEFIDSSGLNDLANAARMVRERGGTMALARPSDRIARVFALVHLAESVPIEETVEDAVTRVAADAETIHTQGTDADRTRT